MKYALKEWNTTIEALGKGQIIAVWRKGGIADTPSVRTPFESFNVEQNKFVLFPTFSHQTQDKVKKDFWLLANQNLGPNADNQVKVNYWAEIEETVLVETLEQLLNASSELANTEEHLKSSWNLYPNHTGKILLLRIYKLSNPILITNSPEYTGCKSWIGLNIDIPKTGSKSVLRYGDFQTKARYIKALLEQAKKIALPPPPVLEEEESTLVTS